MSINIFKFDVKQLVKYFSDYRILLMPQTILDLSKIYRHELTPILVFSGNMVVTELRIVLNS
jgi:hypothetical protein